MNPALCILGQSVSAMEMLSSCALSYCHSGKSEHAACRSVLTLCKWLLADWKDLTPQLKMVVKRNSSSSSLSALSKNISGLLELPLEDQGMPHITTETTGKLNANALNHAICVMNG